MNPFFPRLLLALSAVLIMVSYTRFTNAEEDRLYAEYKQNAARSKIIEAEISLLFPKEVKELAMLKEKLETHESKMAQSFFFNVLLMLAALISFVYAAIMRLWHGRQRKGSRDPSVIAELSRPVTVTTM